MTSRLNGKVCFITAAGQGIGRAIAECFVAEGAIVWSTDLDATKLIGLDPATARALDVRSTEAIDTLAREIGGIDVLVNAAGYVHHGSVLDCAEGDWDLSFDVNVKSMHRTVRAFLPGMLERGNGSIINVASAVSSIRGAPNRYVYGASKAAVIGLTKAIAADFIRAGIRANVICPGTIDSPSLDARIAAQAAATNRSVAEIRQVFVDRQPLGRLGSAKEIAAMAVYLASDESKYTTGAIHIIDGGFSL
ncbi:SDR family oxidoreductase [Microvirga brassicacearum]|uniref:SDR family oxidoreductase n=1 Tax=Microvirga brassicacearum TaxID=2580413 RepID=A0A5N3P6U0_9HYPH|nr:SDR family oxidoreductase [Microvirga brassicacearum]KAB0265447.1 SDR family oxidoreductase [Microvirga brassicacearum]